MISRTRSIYCGRAIEPPTLEFTFPPSLKALLSKGGAAAGPHMCGAQGLVYRLPNRPLSDVDSFSNACKDVLDFSSWYTTCCMRNKANACFPPGCTVGMHASRGASLEP
eukprot:6473686-Amphidinium_carterae.1